MSLTKVTYSLISGAPINVKDFGAVGDGVTDDTLALEAAIGACRGAGKPALYFPAGTYLFSETTPTYGLYINDAITLFGDGPTKTVLKNGSATGAGLRCAGGYITISDIAIDNNYSTGVAFRMGGQFSVTRNLQIKNQAGDAFACVVDGTTLCSVYDLHIFNCTNGISIAPTLPTQYITFNNAVIEVVSGEALAIGASTSITFYGLYIEPHNNAVSITHLIKATGAIDLNFYELSTEFFSALNNTDQAWIVLDGCKSVNFYGGRFFNSIGSTNTVFFAIKGASTRNINFDGLELRSNGAGQTLFSVTDSPFQISWKNITTYGAFSGSGIEYGNSGNGLSVMNWFDANHAYSLTLDSNDVFVSNTVSAISISNRTNMVLVNCQGAITGSGASNVMQLDNLVSVAGAFRPKTDNVAVLGSAGYRWSVVYAATGTINTSDADVKQQISLLSEAELRTAKKCRSLIRSFKFNDAVVSKGDAARRHFGVVAQEVQMAFESEGLNATDYGVFCSDKLDDGTVRRGIRYDELLAFVVASL